MITIYEQLKRAKRGETFFTQRPARNVTSAASRLGRKVTTQLWTVIPPDHRPTQLILLVKVLS